MSPTREHFYYKTRHVNDAQLLGQPRRRLQAHPHLHRQGSISDKRPHPFVIIAVRGGEKQYLTSAHVDRSWAGAELRLRDELRDHEPGDPTGRLVASPGRRCQIVNAWQPIRVVKGGLHRRGRLQLGARLGPGGGQHDRWQPGPSYYKGAMPPLEVFLIKYFDSDESEGLARHALCSAFESPAFVGDESRQSIVLRCPVFCA
ncbi:hypothetical protein GGTG_09775 [Gaeumannomyces tritici R3-111a-1]|uniref:Uncharacterized protein n=1 Tax=Gaeumannomyces tritici (strain R3-111a-1) TaxID=644352 RepID=J3P8E1_GAET3|nr:hypothetical protein GGTG_09775 [Gaeumannomyces tritici R3-111a-1]EJT72924.1 hypothetical protein GGTG_09775 [Gaeumannomyces tritici R3-111a-1]